ncbi:hypothetical protein WICPIJ_001440 [Wickerhamomyces pijperi]|uniref:Uncharacterized protein n=1 Tax=Wickerhamomyces pijperi TaxID=599730 RepID=A0A9P8QDT4_WICPI|nr:hypothetical protein WICPIJ_001440 [Wickerhamomyces pijperi]
MKRIKYAILETVVRPSLIVGISQWMKTLFLVILSMEILDDFGISMLRTLTSSSVGIKRSAQSLRRSEMIATATIDIAQ